MFSKPKSGPDHILAHQCSEGNHVKNIEFQNGQPEHG